MQSTNVNSLLPFVDRSSASTIKVEGKAQREGTSLFGEVLDTVNPLQHVPGVSQAYRAISKDKISNGAKLVGHVGLGAAVAGPVGAAVGAGVYLIESVFGAIFGGGKKGGEKLVQANNVKSGPTALAGQQSIHAGKMRGNGASGPVQPQPQFAAASNAVSQKQRTASPAAPSLGTAPVDMSSAQFAALLGAFGASAPATTSSSSRENDKSRTAAQPQGSAAIGTDFAARMTANLDKLEALKKSQAAQ